LAGSGAHHIK